MNTDTRAKSRLREFLDSQGRRYSWVAERIGVTPSHLTRLMDGERPVTTEVAAKLAELFSVPASSFIESEAS